MESINKTPLDPQNQPSDFQPQDMDTRFMETTESINQARVVDHKYLARHNGGDGDPFFIVKYFDVQDSSADPQGALMNPLIYV